MTDQNSIKLVLIADSSKLSDEYKTIYEEAFPLDERREWEQLTDLLSNPVFNFFGVFAQKKIIGLLSVWNLEDFHFIEHLAIRDFERGQGFGKQVIRQLTSRILTPIILETEMPHSKTAQKRIAFYEGLNFQVSDGNYYQPPYSAHKTKVKMLLMSYPEKITDCRFNQTKSKIYDFVYNFAE